MQADSASGNKPPLHFWFGFGGTLNLLTLALAHIVYYYFICTLNMSQLITSMRGNHILVMNTQQLQHNSYH